MTIKAFFGRKSIRWPVGLLLLLGWAILLFSADGWRAVPFMLAGAGLWICILALSHPRIGASHPRINAAALALVTAMLFGYCGLTTLYFGGDIFNPAKSQADPGKVLRAGRQLAAALDMSNQHYGGTASAPLSIDPLSENYKTALQGAAPTAEDMASGAIATPQNPFSPWQGESQGQARRSTAFSIVSAALAADGADEPVALAYTHSWQVEFAEANVAEAWNRARRACEGDPALGCRLMGAQLNPLGGASNGRATTLSVALPRGAVEAFRAIVLEGGAMHEERWMWPTCRARSATPKPGCG